MNTVTWFGNAFEPVSLGQEPQARWLGLPQNPSRVSFDFLPFTGSAISSFAALRAIVVLRKS